MKTLSQRVRQYAQRKRAGRKPAPLPGGLSKKSRLKHKSISLQKNTLTVERKTQSTKHEAHRAKLREKILNRESVEKLLNELSIRHPLKRQAIQTACEGVRDELIAATSQVHSQEALLAEWRTKYHLLTHPREYDSSTYDALRTAYGLHPHDAPEDIRSHVLFLERALQTAQHEFAEIAQKTPAAFNQIFGKQAGPVMWNIFRQRLFHVKK